MSASTPPLLQRYLAGELTQFFELDLADIRIALDRKLERPRAELAAALQDEGRRLGAPRAALESAERLAHPESKVVVTGQQAGLLLGPAYTISKAMSAVRLARELDSDEAPVVPVFWVASQDHDTEEIDHSYLLDHDEQLRRLHLQLPAQVASGHIPLQPGWREELEAGLDEVGSPHDEYLAEAKGLLADAFDRAESYADLFSALIYRLLGSEGLVVLDPLRPGLAPLFRPTLQGELEQPLASSREIVAAGESLKQMGYEPQLGRGRDATNLFIEEMEEGLPRRRLLHFDGDHFATDTRRYDRGELQEIVAAEPWRITPAAGLRPVAQDAVLPTSAFVVGPGELRYLSQLGGVYELHGVPMPVVWPRAESVVLEPPVRRILDRYGIELERFEAQRSALLEEILLERHGHADTFRQALDRLDSECRQLIESVQAIDPTLAGSVERSRGHLERSLLTMREKAARALARQDETTTRQFGRLEAQLFPAGVPQERILSPFSFLLKFGIEAMMEHYRGMGSKGRHLIEP